MSMPGNDQIVSVVRHCVEHPAIGRVRHPNGNIDIVSVDRSGDIDVAILINMSVVSTSESQPHALDLQRSSSMGEINPSRLLEPAAEILPRQRCAQGADHFDSGP